MWAWQGSNQGSESEPGSSGPTGHSVAPGPPPGQGPAPGQQPQELSDMLQMLDQGGATSFEDLNMFTTTFE